MQDSKTKIGLLALWESGVRRGVEDGVCVCGWGNRVVVVQTVRTKNGLILFPQLTQSEVQFSEMKSKSEQECMCLMATFSETFCEMT